MTLYYLFQPRCRVCRAQRVHVDQFSREHAGRIQVISLAIEPEDRDPREIQIEFPTTLAPSFALQVDGLDVVILHDGAIGTAREIAAWVKRACAKRGVDQMDIR